MTLSPHLKNIKVLSFDNWMTLLKPNPEVRRRRAELLHSYLKLDGYPVQKLEGCIFRAQKMYDHRSDLTGEQFGVEERVMDSVRRLPPGFQRTITSTEAREFGYYSRNLMSEYPPSLIEADLPHTLGILKDSGLKLALVSNTGFVDGVYMRDVFINLRILEFFSIFAFSDEIGFSKPSSQIFGRLITESGVDPVNILHVGDNLQADYFGARKAGINSVLLSHHPVEGLDTTSSIASLVV